MNPKNFNNSPSNTKKKSKGKLVATISSLLGILLLAGGEYYYYSKNAKQKVVNENEIYGTVLKKYKEAINNPDNADSSINVEALKAALKEKKNDDYIKYVFYDIDGNGRKELIISRNDKPNNPFDIYTFDKNHKVIRLFNPETIDSAILNKLGIDGSNNNSGSAVFKDKTIKIRKFDKDTGEYNFLKFSKDGDKLEKTNVITFTGLDTDDSKYKDITNNKEYNSKKEFNDTFPISEVMKFDGEHWQSVKNFGASSSNENNDKKDNNQRKKPDNYETAYASVLKNYKDAISSGKNDAKDVNTVAIGNYKVFGEKQVGNNFLNYGFFDINDDGVDELLLFTEASKNKPNEYSPMDVYTLDKDNKVVRITPERVNGERTTLSITKDKVFQVYGSGGAQVHGYTFYKLNNDGLALEKTDAFDFDGVTNSKVYKRSYPSGKNEEIPVNDFRDKVVNSNNHIKFDFSKRKSIFDFKG
jgi:putative asparagine-rich antigen pfa35-2